MKTSHTQERKLAFTLFEALVIIAVLMIIALFLPAVVRQGSNAHVKATSCLNNLKQVGIAYRIWAADNGDKYPMLVSTNQGGSMELVLAGDVLSTFRAMSNELSTPKILLCPSDAKRHAATNFTDFKVNNISYFVGMDAVETNVMMLLSGDRNITNGTRLRSGILELTTNRLSGWTGEFHQQAGNIGLADGSVQQVSIGGLRSHIAVIGSETNRLAIP